MRYLPQQLAGKYGDVFWDLTPVVVYVANSEIFCHVYVANPTDTDREYMLVLVLLRGGVSLAEYPVLVDELVWFPVEAETVISLPGALLLGYSDVVLTINLYEKEQNKVVDSASIVLTTSGTTGLPGLPEIPGVPIEDGVGVDLSGLVSLMITMMIVVMMMRMMAKMVAK